MKLKCLDKTFSVKYLIERGAEKINIASPVFFPKCKFSAGWELAGHRKELSFKATGVFCADHEGNRGQAARSAQTQTLGSLRSHCPTLPNIFQHFFTLLNTTQHYQTLLNTSHSNSLRLFTLPMPPNSVLSKIPNNSCINFLKAYHLVMIMTETKTYKKTNTKTIPDICHFFTFTHFQS